LAAHLAPQDGEVQAPFGESNGVPLLPDLSAQFVRGVQLGAAIPPQPGDPNWEQRYGPMDRRTPQSGVGSWQDQQIAAHRHGYDQFPAASGWAGAEWPVDWDHQHTHGNGVPTGAQGGGDTHPACVTLIHLIKATSDAGDAPPIGAITMYAGTRNQVAGLGPGWDECDGQHIDDEHTTLMGVLKGSQRPNLRGLFVRGVDANPANRSADAGSRFRVQSDNTTTVDAGPGSVQRSALQAHAHAIQVAKEVTGGYGYLDGSGWQSASEATSTSPAVDLDPTHPAGTETRPANTALYFIISSGM
jgi:hypothetical protein